MLNALKAKRKTGFINGSIPQLADDSLDSKNWKTVNSMIVGWLRASIEPKMKSTVTFISDASQLWDDLKQRFSVGNKVKIYELKAQLASCRQDGQPVVEYYGRLCALWEELQNYKPPAVCTCAASKELTQERAEERIHQFVMGLDEERFGSVCANIVGMDPLPTIGEVYSRIIREEDRLNSKWTHEQHNHAVGFVACETAPARSENQSGGRVESMFVKPRSVSCSHCGRTGHDKKDCWQLMGFLDWWAERSERPSGGRGRGGLGGRGSSAGRGRGQVTVAHATRYKRPVSTTQTYYRT